MKSREQCFAIAGLALLMTADLTVAQTASAPAPGARVVHEQPVGEALASLFIGQDVTNSAGEKIGDVNDLLFDQSGRISSVVIGVGGLLGIGEKKVAVPFGSLAIATHSDGKRVATLALSKDALEKAPEFKPTEKTVFAKAKEKAGEIKDWAVKQVEEMQKGDAKK